MSMQAVGALAKKLRNPGDEDCNSKRVGSIAFRKANGW
jgi:hypothetical protein